IAVLNNVSLRPDSWLLIELRVLTFEFVSVDANGSDGSTSASVRAEVFRPPEGRLKVHSLHNLTHMNVEMVWAARSAEKRRRGVRCVSHSRQSPTIDDL
ncbi:hypothetical protein K488DRAFT_61569, partial [Vararia minispora EC-137]